MFFSGRCTSLRAPIADSKYFNLVVIRTGGDHLPIVFGGALVPFVRVRDDLAMVTNMWLFRRFRDSVVVVRCTGFFGSRTTNWATTILQQLNPWCKANFARQVIIS